MGIALRESACSHHTAGDALEQIEVVDRCRTDYFLQRDELRDGCHFSTTHANEDIVQRRGIETILRCGVGHDAIHLTELVEVTHIRAATISTERSEHGCRRYTCAVALRCIHADLILRESLGVGRHRHHDFLPLVQLGQELGGIGVELRHLAVLHILQHEVHTTVRTVARHLRHLEGNHLRILDVLAVEGEATINEHDVVVHTRTVVPVLQANDKRSVATTRAACHHTVASDNGIALQLGNLLHLLLHLLHNLLCLMQGTALRRTHFGEEHALVFLRNKS